MLLLKYGEKPKPGLPVLLVLGDGRCLLEDVKTFTLFQVAHEVFACNRSPRAFNYDNIRHWGAVDAEEAVWYSKYVAKKNITTHTLEQPDDKTFDVVWDLALRPAPNVLWHGSTTLFGVMAGLGMGYKRIVLAGAPLDINGHWYDEKGIGGPRWDGACYRAWLDFAASNPPVRSMSGYSKQILGEPDREWLNC